MSEFDALLYFRYIVSKELLTAKRFLCMGTAFYDRNIVGKAAEHFLVSNKSMFYRLRDLKLFEPRELDEYIADSLGDLGGTM